MTTLEVELLEALKDCLADLVDIVKAEGGDESDAMIGARAAIEKAERNYWRQARAAIAKSGSAKC